MFHKIAKCITGFFFFSAVSWSYADVISSDQIMAKQQRLISQQQLIAMVDTEQVQQQLMALGVNPEDAKARIANMTHAELVEFQNQLEDLPAGQGVAGAIVTVLLVIAVLDLLGVTDVYPFIRPIDSN
ncbi:PA2779 family protein [Pleionea sediminis]|uniref:PA2779 family protein n=1 Tax=Pleionea sediminis TaxID=2569479 RepID=UPI0011850DEA|nr:PA2779 family protein [Pleionea sediminis]